VAGELPRAASFSDPEAGAAAMMGGKLQTYTARSCLDLKFSLKFHYKKEDFPSHQNIGTCMEY
jgi:hypothetical protein